MLWIIALIAATIFIFGLLNWARGGAGLFQIFKIKRREDSLSEAERAAAEREVKRLEQAADNSIRASFRIICGLAIFIWLFLAVTVILNLMGIDLPSELSSRARTYWVGSTTNHSGHVQGSAAARNDILRGMSGQLK